MGPPTCSPEVLDTRILPSEVRPGLDDPDATAVAPTPAGGLLARREEDDATGAFVPGADRSDLPLGTGPTALSTTLRAPACLLPLVKEGRAVAGLPLPFCKGLADIEPGVAGLFVGSAVDETGGLPVRLGRDGARGDRAPARLPADADRAPAENVLPLLPPPPAPRGTGDLSSVMDPLLDTVLGGLAAVDGNSFLVTALAEELPVLLGAAGHAPGGHLPGEKRLSAAVPPADGLLCNCV